MLTREQKLKLAEDNKDISTEIIKEDIEDTKDEIAQYHRHIIHFDTGGTRLDAMKVEYYRNGIKEREELVEKLEGILEIRKAK